MAAPQYAEVECLPYMLRGLTQVAVFCGFWGQFQTGFLCTPFHVLLGRPTGRSDATVEKADTARLVSCVGANLTSH